MNEIYNSDYFKETRKKLKKVLSSSRYEHTLGVEFTSAALAMRYDYDITKAKIAGLLHDCAKCIDDNEKLEECIKYGVEVTPTEMQCKFLLHSKLGEYYAKNKYYINDDQILNAIKYHTTGRPSMTLIEKIIFVADYIEPSRDKAPNLSQIRKLSFIDIDKAVLKILEDTLIYLEDNSGIIDTASKETYKYYKSYVSPSKEGE